MAKFGVTFNKGVANVQGVGYLLAAAASPRRAKIYDWSFGSASNPPVDVPFIHIAQRANSTSLASSARTPNALDQADTLASTIQASDTVTVDGTLTANAFDYQAPLNQRNSFRWVAAPGSEIVIPATANTGVMLGLSAATTTTFNYGVMFEEQ